MKNANNTVILKGAGRREEYEANSAGDIYPGLLLDAAAAGDNHLKYGLAAADGVGPLVVATEDVLQGHSVRDAYAAVGDIVFAFHPKKGDLLFLRGTDNFAAGAKVRKIAGGLVSSGSVTAANEIGVVEEASDNTGTSTANNNNWVKIRVT